jgi:hypothetical protein
MRVTIESAAPKPSLEHAKTILAQVYLLTALEELTDLRRTMRLQAVALAELRQKSSLPPAVVTELLATVQRRDRQFVRRLGKLQTNVNKANRHLIPLDGEPEPAR